MAVHGLSLAERKKYILADDPAHPDNIQKQFALRVNNADDTIAQDKLMQDIRKEVGEPTVFLLGNLLHEDRVFLSDMSGGMEQTPQGTFRMTPKNTQKASEAVRRALKGWENFLDGEGNIIPFSTAPGVGERGQPRAYVSPEAMSQLHLDIIKELASEILDANGVTGVVEKKLLSALQVGSGLPSPDGLVENATTETKSSAVAESQA